MAAARSRPGALDPHLVTKLGRRNRSWRASLAVAGTGPIVLFEATPDDQIPIGLTGVEVIVAPPGKVVPS